MSTFSKLAHYIWSKRLHIVGKTGCKWPKLKNFFLKKDKSAHPSCPQAGTAHRPQTLWLAVCCVLCAVLWLWACACALSVLCAVCCVLCAVCWTLLDVLICCWVLRDRQTLLAHHRYSMKLSLVLSMAGAAGAAPLTPPKAQNMNGPRPRTPRPAPAPHRSF
jgi:Flp pilus assembly protein TadB